MSKRCGNVVENQLEHKLYFWKFTRTILHFLAGGKFGHPFLSAARYFLVLWR